MSEDVISIILMAHCFTTAWFVGGLTVLHFYLSCTNQATYERYQLRWLEKTMENPYDRGVIRNLKGRFLSKTRASLINFREWVTYEDFSTESIAEKFPCRDYEATEED